jgi:thioredoxin-like negative regulator of GroEL
MNTLTAQEEFNELYSGAPGRFAVWFSATWCGPCKRITAALEDLKAAAAMIKLPFYYCDVDALPGVVAACHIRSVPTFIVFEKNAEIARLTSSDPQAVCRFFLDKGRK